MDSSVSPFDAFPEQVRDDIDGLTYLGYLDTYFSSAATILSCAHFEATKS